MNNPRKYKFFIASSEGWNNLFCFIASREETGFLCYKYISNNSESPIFKIKEMEKMNGYVEISFNRALKIINDLKTIYKREILKCLEIEEQEIVVTEEMKSKIVNNLKYSRAFNEDSALEIDGEEFEFYCQLYNDKVIQRTEKEDRFYIP